jgi:hypothetical protein
VRTTKMGKRRTSGTPGRHAAAIEMTPRASPARAKSARWPGIVSTCLKVPIRAAGGLAKNETPVKRRSIVP